MGQLMKPESHAGSPFFSRQARMNSSPDTVPYVLMSHTRASAPASGKKNTNMPNAIDIMRSRIRSASPRITLCRRIAVTTTAGCTL